MTEQNAIQTVDQYLEKNFPKEDRKKVLALDMGTIFCRNYKDRFLSGMLSLDDFINLQFLYFKDNMITGIRFQNVSFESLVCVDLSNNQIDLTNVRIFNKFVNLTALCIGTDDGHVERTRSYNNFFGSLESLQDLSQLRILDISNTLIDGGYEYLPNLEEFSISDFREEKESIDVGHSRLIEEINGYGAGFNEWKQLRIGIIRQVDKITSLERNIKIIREVSQKYLDKIRDYKEELERLEGQKKSRDNILKSERKKIKGLTKQKENLIISLDNTKSWIIEQEQNIENLREKIKKIEELGNDQSQKYLNRITELTNVAKDLDKNLFDNEEKSKKLIILLEESTKTNELLEENNKKLVKSIKDKDDLLSKNKQQISILHNEIEELKQDQEIYTESNHLLREKYEKNKEEMELLICQTEIDKLSAPYSAYKL